MIRDRSQMAFLIMLVSVQLILNTTFQVCLAVWLTQKF